MTKRGKGVIELASCTKLVRIPLLSFSPKDMHIIHRIILFFFLLFFYF